MTAQGCGDEKVKYSRLLHQNVSHTNTSALPGNQTSGETGEGRVGLNQNPAVQVLKEGTASTCDSIENYRDPAWNPTIFNTLAAPSSHPAQSLEETFRKICN